MRIKDRLVVYEDYVRHCVDLKIKPLPVTHQGFEQHRIHVHAKHFEAWRKERMDVV